MVQLQTFDISNLDYVIYQNSLLKMSKVCGIGLQIYRELKIWVCGKDSNPLAIT